MIRLYIIFYIVLLCLTHSVFAQSVSISSIQVTPDGQVGFNYTINQNHDPRERYDVKIFTSIDNFQKPLKTKFNDIEPNKTYPVTLDGNNEFGDFTGEFSIRLEAAASEFPTKITEHPKKLKPGKKYEIKWDGIDGPYNVYLMDSGGKIILEENIEGNFLNSYLTKDTRKGKGFKLIVESSRESKFEPDSAPIQIVSKKTALFLSLLGAGITAPLVYILTRPEPISYPQPPNPPE